MPNVPSVLWPTQQHCNCSPPSYLHAWLCPLALPPFHTDLYFLCVDLSYQEKVIDIWSFQAFCVSRNTKVLVVVVSWRSSDGGMWYFGDLLGLFPPAWNLAHSIVMSLQLPLQGESRRRWLKCVSAGMRMCPVFLEHIFPSCRTVCVLLSLKGLAKFLKERSPGRSPRGSREAETPQFLDACAAVPWPRQGPEIRGETAAEASSSPLRQLQAGKPRCWQPSRWGSLWLNFPAWKSF